MPVKNYRSDLLVRLVDPEYAAHYLKAALEATLEDGDREAFLLALSNVAEAQAAIGAAANDVNGTHEDRYTQLKDTDSLSVETLLSVLDTVGLAIDFKPA